MSSRIIELQDKVSGNPRQEDNLREKVSISSGNMHGEVSIFERDKRSGLTKLLHKSNMIVFSGRAWLLRKAFGSSLDNNDSGIYNKEIRWFGCGNGGGEPGNPLQAGPTLGQDTGLYQPVRLRSDLTISDPGYSLYASDYLGNFGYYKRFASVIIREDQANPYTVNNVTNYPPLIAEVRIELSSDDANSGSYEDLNEAALFVADPASADPGLDAITGGGEYIPSIPGANNILKVASDGDYGIYYLDTYDIASEIGDVKIGDFLWTNAPTPNNIPLTGKLMIVDIFNGTSAVNKGYIVVEKPGILDTTYPPTYPVAHLIAKTNTPYIMFSRVTFSTVRKTVDREIVFLWKIYF